jgi:hypothetical protein
MIYRFKDRHCANRVRYVGQSVDLHERIGQHTRVGKRVLDEVETGMDPSLTLLRAEVLRRKDGSMPVRYADFAPLDELPDGVPECRADGFEAAGIDKYNTVHSDERNPHGLNATIGNNVATTDTALARRELDEGYVWPKVSSAIVLAPELAAATRKVEIFESVHALIGDLDPNLHRELEVAQTEKAKLERLATTTSPFALARSYREDYAEMTDGAEVYRTDVVTQLNAVAAMDPEDKELQDEHKHRWLRMAHPNVQRMVGKPMYAAEAAAIFTIVETLCGQKLEDALVEKHRDPDYDVFAHPGRAGSNHVEDALALRAWMAQNGGRMPSMKATSNKDADDGASVEAQLGQKMNNWKRDRKGLDTYTVILRHAPAFAHALLDIKPQARDQSETLFKLLMAGHGLKQVDVGGEPMPIDPNATPMPKTCFACGKDDVAYQSLYNYARGKKNAMAEAALARWAEAKPGDNKADAYHAAHEKNVPHMQAKDKKKNAKRDANRRAYKAARASPSTEIPEPEPLPASEPPSDAESAYDSEESR